MSYLIKAINSLKPGAEFVVFENDYATIEWHLIDGDAPTKAQIEATKAKIDAAKAKIAEARVKVDAAIKQFEKAKALTQTISNSYKAGGVKGSISAVIASQVGGIRAKLVAEVNTRVNEAITKFINKCPPERDLQRIIKTKIEPPDLTEKIIQNQHDADQKMYQAR